MAEETAAPAPASLNAPAASSPVAVAANEAAPSVAVSAEPSISPAESVGPTAVTQPSTVLGVEPVKEETPKEGDKPVDPVENIPDTKKEEGSQSEEPAPLPAYEAFTLPDDLTVDTERLGTFTKLLGEFENSKPNHEGFQQFGQSLVDYHIAEVQENTKRLNESYIQAWEKQKNDWKESFIKDPEIGGNRKDTTINSALEFIRTHGGNETQQTEFRNLMESTGVGNHPAMIRMLANAMQAYREGKPLPAARPAPETRSRVATRYGNTN